MDIHRVVRAVLRVHELGRDVCASAQVPSVLERFPEEDEEHGSGVKVVRRLLGPGIALERDLMAAGVLRVLVSDPWHVGLFDDLP